MFKLHQNSLFEDWTDISLEPVGGKFQPSFEIVHPGGGAHLKFILNYKNVTQTPLSAAGSSFNCRTRRQGVLNQGGKV
jgi:hypothetical protein